MAKYTYKGVDIGNLIVAGSTVMTNYNGLTYTAAANPNYTTERPLPFSITQQGTDISNKMDAKYVEFTGSGTYSIPSDFNGFRAVLEGGGGGGGGKGGCGFGYYSGDTAMQRHPGGTGAAAGNGIYTYISDINIDNSPRTITYKVGAAGAAGPGGKDNGGAPGNKGSGTPGNDGQQGQESYINFNFSDSNYIVSAGGGGGGQRGYGGSTTSNGSDNTAIIAAINTTTTLPPTYIVNVDANSPLSVAPAIVNPISYMTAYSNGGTSAGAGQSGYIRLYLLRD